MSKTPTWAIDAANKSGRWLMHAPINNPPFEPPWIANYEKVKNYLKNIFQDNVQHIQRCRVHCVITWLFCVYLFSIRNSPAAMKSSNTFCLFNNRPPLCHFSPYSPPPRMLGYARTPSNKSTKANNVMLKLGWIEMLNPPYPYKRVGFGLITVSGLFLWEQKYYF